MPKVGSRRIREMKLSTFEKFLKERGYFYSRSSGTSHHVYKNPETNKKVTVVSKHGRTIHPKTVVLALDELKVSSKEFGDWIENH